MLSAIRPVQKIGIETPASATVIAARSKNDRRLNADRTPTETPKITQITAAPTASEKVTGARSISSGNTACRVRKE